MARADGRPSAELAEALKFLDHVKETLRRKNAEYGNSAFEPVRIFSRADAAEQLRVRLDDKLSRVVRGGAVDLELLTDIAGYVALLAATLKHER